MRVLRGELTRYDGPGFHVEDEACASATVLVSKQARGEELWRDGYAHPRVVSNHPR